MSKRLATTISLISLVASFFARKYYMQSGWLAVYPPTTAEIFYSLLPYGLLLIGIVFASIAIIKSKYK